MDPSSDTPISTLLQAVAFAAHKHRDQRRKDAAASPYVNHPIALAQLLDTHDVREVEVLCAALLHDTIEDTETTADELASAFGERVASVVLEVSDDKALPKSERKRLQVVHAASASREARLVKLADKICNLRDILESPPAGWALARRIEYFHWAKSVIDSLRGTHASLEAEFDALHASGLERLRDLAGAG
jgi:GTP diphosphokinase / guanosine-3',5'-bis(diphosphate) 3'-diphosphatase